MRVVVGFDHAGLPIRESVIAALRSVGAEVIEVGTTPAEQVDYPDVVKAACEVILAGKADRAVLACGSGVGVSLAANKMRGILAAVCHDVYSAEQGVRHDNMNVLCLGGKVIGDELAGVLVRAFVGSNYQGLLPGNERFERRVAKIRAIESAH